MAAAPAIFQEIMDMTPPSASAWSIRLVHPSRYPNVIDAVVPAEDGLPGPVWNGDSVKAGPVSLAISSLTLSRSLGVTIGRRTYRPRIIMSDHLFTCVRPWPARQLGADTRRIPRPRREAPTHRSWHPSRWTPPPRSSDRHSVGIPPRAPDCIP